MKPRPADILVAIGKIATGDWVDPLDAPICWTCHVYAPDGGRAGDGSGRTAGEAMAVAWILVWDCDAFDRGRRVVPGSIPFDIPEGWRFELSPPWQSKPELLRWIEEVSLEEDNDNND